MPSFLHSGNHSFFLNDTYAPVVDLQSKLAYMWDAEYSSSITRDGGGLVSEWRDLVDGTPMVQATAANKPVYSATSFGGGAGVTFDGVSDELTYTIPGSHRFPLGANPHEFWVLLSFASPDTDTTPRYLFGYGANGGLRQVGRIGLPYPGGYHNRVRLNINGTGTVSVNPGMDVGVNTRLFFRAYNNGTTTVVQNNGSEYSSDNLSAPMVPITLTGRARIGASPTTVVGAFFQGTVACVALFSKILNVDEIDALAGYMQQRRRL